LLFTYRIVYLLKNIKVLLLFGAEMSQKFSIVQLMLHCIWCSKEHSW